MAVQKERPDARKVRGWHYLVFQGKVTSKKRSLLEGEPLFNVAKQNGSKTKKSVCFRGDHS